MALAFFLLSNLLIILFGIGFVILTLRHHRKAALERKVQADLRALQQLSEEKHI